MRGLTPRRRRFAPVAGLSIIGIMAMVLLIGCGGGSSSSSTSPSSGTNNPAPVLTFIAPSSAPEGSKPLTLTVTGNNFVTSSVVRWGGSARSTSYVNSTKLTATITADDLASSGTASVTVYTPTPGGGISAAKTFTINRVDALALATAQLPSAAPAKRYSYPLQSTGGISPYRYELTGGSLPAGFTLDQGGVISGNPPAVSSDTLFAFNVRVIDNSYQPRTITAPLSILVRAGSLGRNDACSSATAISNGVIRASISPYGDVDVYSFQGTAGNTVTIQIYAQRLTLYEGSTTTDVFLDPFLELLNSNCVRLHYNDDIDPGVITDSLISNYQLPYTGTYFIRVSDLRADGRPDFIYDLHLSGAN